MKTVALFVLLTCYYVGGYQYCYDTSGRTATCYQVGSYTYCY